MSNPISSAMGDAILTSGWVFCLSSLSVAASYATTFLQLQSSYVVSMSITVTILFFIVFFFNIVAEVLGGASCNPISTASYFAAGAGFDTLLSLALRLPAQVVGGVGGAMAVVEVMPSQYRHLVVVPRLKVDLQTAAIAEGVLAFLLTFLLLVIVINGPSNWFPRSWLIALVTLAAFTLGADYTGPSINPAYAYGWAYIEKWHNTREQFYVYWIGPFIGSILAGWIYRALTFFRVKKAKNA